MRKGSVPEGNEAPPWLCLRGVSQGNMQETLSPLPGTGVGAPPTQLTTRLERRWEKEYEEWSARSPEDPRIVYVWVAAACFRAHGTVSGAVCMLVLTGADDQDKKLSLTSGPSTRKSAHCWQHQVQRLVVCGLTTPHLVVADGIIGFGAPLGKTFPQTRQQRGVGHKTHNVLNSLSGCLHAQDKKDLHETRGTLTHKEVERTARHSGKVCRSTCQKVGESIGEGQGQLLVSRDFPAECWYLIRSTSVARLVFATARLRTRQTGGSDSLDAVAGMVCKLVVAAQRHSNRLCSFKRITQVLEFVPFRGGVRQETESAPAA